MLEIEGLVIANENNKVSVKNALAPISANSAPA